MNLFDRKVWLKVENKDSNPSFQTITIKDLNVDFDIRRTLEKEPSTLSARVFNLSSSTRAKLEESDRLELTLSAGYGTNVHDLFIGDLRTIRHSRQGADLESTLEAGDGEKGAKNWARKWFGKGASVLAIARYLVRVAQVGEGNISDLVNINENYGLPSTLRQGMHVRGYALDELNELCRSRGAEFSIQNNEVQIVPFNNGVSGVPVPQLTPDTGLVGTPVIDNEKVMTCECILIPNVFPGSLVDIQSEFVTGRFKVKNVDYSGSLYGSDFRMSVEGKQIG